MYNYVIAIKDYNTDKPIALKVGETRNEFSKRFQSICQVDAKKYFDKEVYIEPLHLVQGNYGKETARLIEDTFRLYFLKKFGIDKAFKRDYFLVHSLPEEYDKEAEAEDVRNLVLPFTGSGATLVYSARSNDPKNIYCKNFAMTVAKWLPKKGD